MLSRVAQRLYWLSRYLERTEDTGRLVKAYSHLILDIPAGSGPDWDILLATISADDAFKQRYSNPTERNINKFLLADTSNDASLRWSVRRARENMRTTREALPAQAWELINELYLYVEDNGSAAVTRQTRFDFLEEVIAHCQQITGLIESTVLREHGLWFMQLGRLLERADMTSRVVDVGAKAIIENGPKNTREIPLLWGNLLKSLSATSAYRRKVGPTLNADDVVEFLFRNHQFPRSIAFCLISIEELIGQLNGPDGMMRQTRKMTATLNGLDETFPDLNALHEFIDQLQIDLAELDAGIFEHWFAGIGR